MCPVGTFVVSVSHPMVLDSLTAVRPNNVPLSIKCAYRCKTH
jgi:hypothetical protein